MRAIAVTPGVTGSAGLDEIPPPPESDGPVLVDTALVGVCGTDVEIVDGKYGWAPPGAERLVLGHESLGRVREAPDGSALVAGDLVVGIVRRPDPVPCSSCAVSEWDMCRNGQYTERGIKARHGYASDQFRIHPEYAVKVDPALEDVGVLLEPASVVAKAWEHIERIGARAHWAPRKVLVTGAGPIGMLAALFGAQRGLDVHVFDRNRDGPKPQLIRDLGAAHHAGDIPAVAEDSDVVIECTGADEVVVDVMQHNGVGAVVCLTGVSSGGRTLGVDAGALNRDIVLGNDVIFGSVNANRRHYEQAADALARADRAWLSRIITRREPPEQFAAALQRGRTDVKVVVDFSQ
jgi:threonine dehydrogenase-like Zn-dependent dehydrogenase